MGLLQKAVETYDAMEHLAGVMKDGEEPLAPIGHICTTASIEVTINKEGSFVQAKNNDQKIIIPATEESAGRSGINPSPHPLCDQLAYISGCNGNERKRELYLEQLRSWCKFDGNQKLHAILKYVSEGSIIDDLMKANLVKIEKGEIKNEKDLVCWRVVGLNEKDSAVWTDAALHNSFIKFYSSLTIDDKKDISYVSGELDTIAKQHLKGIFSNAGNAKLISSNDSTNFTYKGRFFDSGEALTVSYKDSQKAHNALKWVISNQGITIGGKSKDKAFKSFVCWNPNGIELPRPFFPLLDLSAEKAIPTNYRDMLYKKIMSYNLELSPKDGAVIASFEAATSGRLSVTYYNELSGSDFLNRLQEWDEWCCWNDNRWGTSAPSLIDILKFSFGVQRGNDDSAKVEIDDRVLGQGLQRLLISRLERAPFPTDVMRSLILKTQRPESYNKMNRDKLQFIACAVVRKYRHDRLKEEWNMALEPDNKDRSYQFGRLLAVLEKAEKDAYREYKLEETRETNAIRMQSVFVQRPGYASKLIIDRLKNAYYPRLGLNQRVFYEKTIGQIMEIISESGEAEYNKPLKETYIMGYYLQKNNLYTKKNVSEEEA